MTVSSNTSTATFLPNNATVFPLPFRFFSNDDLNVYRIDATTGAATIQTLGVDYTLTGAGDPEVDGNATGVLTLVSPLTIGGPSLFIERVMEVEQPTDIVNQGRFFPEVHEDAFDRLTMLIQQADASGRGAIRVAIGDPEPSRLLPAPSRANQLMGFDSAGNPIAVSPVDGDLSDFALRLANSTDPALGGAMVGLTRRNGLAGRTVAQMSAERVSIEDFRIPGQVDWTQALADAAAYMIAQSQAGTPKILEFNANEVYEASVFPNWRWHNMWIRGNGCLWRNTGTGDTLICDAGPATFQLRNVSITGVRVEGGTTSGHGVFIRGINASEFEVEVRGCGTAFHAFQLIFTVLNEYRFKASSIAFPFVGGAIPLRGIVMGERGVGEKCSACTFYNPVIEGVSERGILLQGALQNTFLGGTSESNGATNVEVQSVAFHNQFIGMDIEQSGTGISIIDAGRWNRWNNIYADQQVNIGATAIGCKMRDSLMNSVDDQGLGSTLDCIDYNINAGTFTLSGAAVASQEARRIRNTTTGTFLPSKFVDASFGPAGQAVKRHNHAAVAIAAPPVPGSVPGSSVVSGVSVPGAQVNDTVIVTAGQPSNYTVYGVVTAPDTVQIRWHQITGAAASPLPAGGTVRIDTWGH